MNETPNKTSRFRSTPMGKYIFQNEVESFNTQAYTLALLNSDTSEEFNRSVGVENGNRRKSRKVFSTPRAFALPNRDEIAVYWHKVEVEGWKPETRQQASLTYFNDKLYLIGGISRSINKDVNVFQIQKKTWNRVDCLGDVSEPRFGHSAVRYDGKIIVYGGGTHFDTVHKLRECLSGVFLFHLNDNRWEYLKTKGTYLPSRKYHSSVIIASQMFIYGGMNQRNNFLSDPALLNLKKNSWKSVEVSGEGPGKVSFHSACLVLNPLPSKNESIYSFSSNSTKLRHPGVYFFGGLSSDKTAKNTLHVLTLGKRPLTWTSPQTSGRPPSPRFLHSMVYNASLNLLIIFGGRVDLMSNPVYTCFNDVFLLDMQSLIWITVNVVGDVPAGRAGHAAETADHRLFVFGGVTNSAYCSGDVWSLELDPNAALSLAEIYMKKLKHLSEVESYRKSQGNYSHGRSFSRSRTKRFASQDVTEVI
jgi:N-acetylneuraminic acid mutarotase